MSVLRFPDKDPGDRLDYGADFQDVLDSAEQIVARTWTIPGGLVNHSDSIAADGKSTSVIISGGIANTVYTLTISVTTDVGTPARIWERDLKLKVRNI